MMLSLPKVRRDGQFRATAIDAIAITGIEPHVVRFGNKQYAGSKVFTNLGSFYVLAAPETIAAAKMVSLKSGAFIEIPSLTDKHGTLKAISASVVNSKVQKLLPPV